MVSFPSIPPRLVPPATALVLEGGGTRGYFSSGVMDAFTEAGIMFPYIVGVSAGAANALTYVSGQFGRSRYIAEHYVSDPRYVGLRNLLLHRSLFNYKFIFKTIPDRYVPFDWEAFRLAPTKFFIGAIDVRTGETVFFAQDEYQNDDWSIVTASCSVPVISRIVKHNKQLLLDGGVNGGIPIDRSIADGNEFHVIIMTRAKGYVKKPEPYWKLRKIIYRRYPKLLEAMDRRHIEYARQVALCEQLEREGSAVIIRPESPIWEGRAENSPDKLVALYDEGLKLGREAIKRII